MVDSDPLADPSSAAPTFGDEPSATPDSISLTLLDLPRPILKQRSSQHHSPGASPASRRIAAMQPKASSKTAWRVLLRGHVGGVDRHWPVLDGRNRVGRDLANEIVIDEDGVSRHHATVWLEAGRLVVTDARSKNGTFLNGQPVARAEISAGDIVAFGPIDLRCEETTPEETELAVDLADSLKARAPSHPTDTLTARSIVGRQSSWLTLGRSFSSTLRKTGEAPTALASLVLALQLRGAALLRRTSTQPPTLLAATGRIETHEIDAIAEIWASGRGGLALVDDLCGFAPSDASYPWCLILAGNFHRRGESSELLALLVEAYASWHSTRLVDLEPPPRSSSARQAPPDLRFPAGYVPGTSASMRSIYQQMQSLVLGDQPILVIGETGVGKEPIVRTLHDSSARAEKPFVAINCAAVPTDLLEAEFFGIGDRVATGVAGRLGLFRRADGGTIFLDEVGTMALDLQAKLLRVLQEREIFPIGSSKPVPINARVVAATNVSLQTEIECGRFRNDLYYRLAGYELHIPPLRDRREDVSALVEWFLRRSCNEIGRPIRGLTAGAMRDLVARPWPGNVRQLEHEIRGLVLRCPASGFIDRELLRSQPSASGAMPSGTMPSGTMPSGTMPSGTVARSEAATAESAPRIPDEPQKTESKTDSPPLALEALEKGAVEEALRRSGGNQRQAAVLLGITRSSLRRRLKRYSIG